MLILVLVATLGTGCGTPPHHGVLESPEPPMTTLDGLVRREIETPGALYLRDSHQIGSYDAFQIETSEIAYQRRSLKLPAGLEQEFAEKLMQTLVAAASAADIPVLESPGPCVMQIVMHPADVNIAESTAQSLAEMKLIMEFRDSLSGQPLLRFITDNRIEKQGDEVSWSDQIRERFDEMVAEMDIGAGLRGAGLADDELLPGCKGTLAERGRAAASAQSAR